MCYGVCKYTPANTYTHTNTHVCMASKYNNSKQQRMLPTCRRTKRAAKLFAQRESERRGELSPPYLLSRSFVSLVNLSLIIFTKQLMLNLLKTFVSSALLLFSLCRCRCFLWQSFRCFFFLFFQTVKQKRQNAKRRLGKHEKMSSLNNV